MMLRARVHHSSMNIAEMIAYVREQRDGVVATNGPGGVPEAAYLTFAATDDGEIVFDARPESRKVANLREDPRVAVVVGGPDGRTLQADGEADFPDGADLRRCAAAYAEAFPTSADALSRGMVFIRIRLRWARFRDYRAAPPLDTEVTLA